jgi:hypothetical protein
LCEQFDALLPKLVRRALAHKFDGLFGSAKTRDREAFRPLSPEAPGSGAAAGRAIAAMFARQGERLAAHHCK